MEQTRLALLGDDLLLREVLERILAAEPGMAVVASTRLGPEALAVLGRERVDLVLLDLDGGAESGFELLTSRRASGRTARILVLTRGLTPALTVRALQLGVAGIFVKTRSFETLLNAVRSVVAGEAWLEPDAIRLLAGGVQEYLTPREDEILQGVLDGLTNAEIATRTALPEGVVKSALQRLFQKAGVRTRGQLIRAALEGSLGAARK